MQRSSGEMTRRVLVTGGAGFIGSHMVELLVRSGHEPVVIDSLVTGNRDAVPASVPFLHADVADRERVLPFLREHRVSAALHFASLSQVGESVTAPRRYYVNNLAGGIGLLESALDAGVRHFILSSTAAVYGVPTTTPIVEAHATAPINPYGETKLAIERMLASYAAHGLSYAALRYFNAAGADAAHGLGERHEPESHLIPIVLDVALGRRDEVTVMGTDYPTPDGTCVRDYIHVVDLCEAHLAALAHLARGGASGAFNLGTGQGHSVREVVDVARRVTGRAIAVREGARRQGDPPFLVADPSRAEATFGWRARHRSLERIIQDAWDHHRRAFAPDGPRPAHHLPRPRALDEETR